MPQDRKSGDLAVRTASGLVMIAIAGAAFWLGGTVWKAFAVLLGLGVVFEWRVLTLLGNPPGLMRWLWTAAGCVYVTIAIWTAIVWHGEPTGTGDLLAVIGAVVATDIGAYLVGRAVGGPKIAPRISPSKTWSGLIGGMTGASALLLGFFAYEYSIDIDQFASDGRAAHATFHWGIAIIGGILIAIAAQAGDFFESWLKRRAGVKDSGKLIPGHGGLFDRLDGLLAVLFLLGAANLVITGI